MRLVDRTLECVDVSQQLAFKGVLPWMLSLALCIGVARGSMSIETATQIGIAIFGSQVLGRIRIGRGQRQEDPDDR